MLSNFSKEYRVAFRRPRHQGCLRASQVPNIYDSERGADAQRARRVSDNLLASSAAGPNGRDQIWLHRSRTGRYETKRQ